MLKPKLSKLLSPTKVLTVFLPLKGESSSDHRIHHIYSYKCAYRWCFVIPLQLSGERWAICQSDALTGGWFECQTFESDDPTVTRCYATRCNSNGWWAHWPMIRCYCRLSESTSVYWYVVLWISDTQLNRMTDQLINRATLELRHDELATPVCRIIGP